MRKFIFIISILSICFFVLNCSRYHILKETSKPPDLNRYNKIYVSWLNLNESDWETYGYGSIKAWKVCIKEMNLLGLQKYLQDLLPNKKISGDKSQSRVLPTDEGLYVKSNIIKIERSWGRIRSINVRFHFYDIKTKKKLYDATVEATSRGAHWNNFEALLDATVYNMAKFIAEKIE